MPRDINASIRKLERLAGLRTQQTLELTESTPDELAQGQRLWPSVTYQGKDVLKWYIRLLSKIEARLAEDLGLHDSQECYLGYSPSKDLFVVGFDAWFSYPSVHGMGSEPEAGWAYAPVKPMSSTIYDGEGTSGDGMFYDSGYKEAHRAFRDLVDLRLD